MDPMLAIIGTIGWPELVVILVLVLVIFGPRRLPEIAEAFGRSIGKFRKATRGATDEVKRELDEAARDARRAGHDENGGPGRPEPRP